MRPLHDEIFSVRTMRNTAQDRSVLHVYEDPSSGSDEINCGKDLSDNGLIMGINRSPLAVVEISDRLIRKMINRPDYLKLFLNWSDVVGPYMSALCLPHRVINVGPEKILILKTIKGHGLEVQYEANRILGMVNGFLKIKLFSQIRIIQLDTSKF
ncbi:MAG: DciA family protein [Holosporaceae bacterium]|jgi:hypothetical protein|nr:DciA family protein [Holosporaceae bacterium]